MTRSEKIMLTKEIKLVQEHINDMEEMMQKQGTKFFFMFEGRSCPRYMLLGEYFTPSTVKKERKYLEQLLSKKNSK
jgi:hypothetical protein